MEKTNIWHCDDCDKIYENAYKCERCGNVTCDDCHEIHDTDNCINREDIHA